MRALADTHAVLWWFLDSPQLSPAARSAMESADNQILVSAASGWEIATKHRIGKLGLEGWDPRTLPDLLRRGGFDVLPVSMAHALEAGLLPAPHRDPFNRMLIAQSRLESLPVITVDPVFAEYGVEVIW